jgi:hypothetical protein
MRFGAIQAAIAPVPVLAHAYGPARVLAFVSASETARKCCVGYRARCLLVVAKEGKWESSAKRANATRVLRGAKGERGEERRGRRGRTCGAC